MCFAITSNILDLSGVVGKTCIYRATEGNVFSVQYSKCLRNHTAMELIARGSGAPFLHNTREENLLQRAYLYLSSANHVDVLMEY